MRSKMYEILLLDFTNPGVENQRTVYERSQKLFMGSWCFSILTMYQSWSGDPLSTKVNQGILMLGFWFLTNWMFWSGKSSHTIARLCDSSLWILILIIHIHTIHHPVDLDDDQPVMARGVVPLSIYDCHARLLSLSKPSLTSSSSSSFPQSESKSWWWLRSDQSALWSESIRLRLPLVSCLCPLVHSNHLCFHYNHDENDDEEWWWWSLWYDDDGTHPHAIRVETNWTVGGKHLK